MQRTSWGWFLYLLAIGFLTAYVTLHAVPADAHYLAVFRLAGAVAFLAHAGALWPQSIWFRKSWVATLKSTVDGLAYALVTAGTFGWLWPRWGRQDINQRGWDNWRRRLISGPDSIPSRP